MRDQPLDEGAALFEFSDSNPFISLVSLVDRTRTDHDGGNTRNILEKATLCHE
jgi:hypothetical protein